MRCESCTKFVSLEDADELEIDSLDVDDDGLVTGTARFVRTCADCGTEMKEMNFDVEIALNDEFAGHSGPGHDLEVEETNSSISQKTGNYVWKRTAGAKKDEPKVRTFVAKYGRYAKTWYEVEVSVDVRCSCGTTADGKFTQEFTASEMEELS